MSATLYVIEQRSMSVIPSIVRTIISLGNREAVSQPRTEYIYKYFIKSTRNIFFMKTVLKPLCICMYVDGKIIDSKETVVSLALQQYDAACQLAFLTIQSIRNVAFLYVEEYRE